MFITTRVTRSTWIANPECIQQQINPACADRGNPANSTFFYYAGVEDFTVSRSLAFCSDCVDINRTYCARRSDRCDCNQHENEGKASQF
jgi:hypothetical protein